MMRSTGIEGLQKRLTLRQLTFRVKEQIEYDILKLLMTHPGEVFSPKEIYREVWHDNPLGSDNTVAVHIRHLREKIEINPADPRYLMVVWGQGYKMEDKR